MTKEVKSLPVYTKAIEDRTVIGLVAMMGNVDSYYDVVHKGSFKKTIKEGFSRIRHLWMHDVYQPPTAAIKKLREVGRDEIPEDVLKEFPDVTGALEITREYLRTPRADEILEGIKANAINQMSFGYDPIKYDYEERKSDDGVKFMVRNLREIRLWDTSDVNWGANEATVASKMFPLLEAYQGKMPEEQFLLLGQLADTVSLGLSQERLKEGRVLSSANLDKLKSALQVLSEILLAAEPPEDEESAKALTEEVLRKLQFYQRDPILISVR